LKLYLSELEERNYFGKIFLIGPGYSELEQRAFQPAFRRVARALAEYLLNPVSGDAPAPVDLFWEHLLESPRDHGAKCRHLECDQEPLAAGVFCPAHHYEQIKGRSPPDETIGVS